MSSNEMTPAELSDWMRKERETLIELSKVLRQHIAAKPDLALDDWLLGLRAGFQRLLTHLQRHYAAKTQGGYLTPVVEQRPSLSKQVEQMCGEHSEILHMGEKIHEELAIVIAEQKLLVADICARVQRFMAIVADHDQREIMLTMYVFSQDIGETG